MAPSATTIKTSIAIITDIDRTMTPTVIPIGDHAGTCRATLTAIILGGV